MKRKRGSGQLRAERPDAQDCGAAWDCIALEVAHHAFESARGTTTVFTAAVWNLPRNQTVYSIS